VIDTFVTVVVPPQPSNAIWTFIYRTHECSDVR